MVLGSPIANRMRPELEGLIGFFANTLALRLRPSAAPTFKALLEQARQVALGAYAHQDLPFERLVETLGVERSLDRTPVFQAMLVLQNAQQGTTELPGVKLRSLLGVEQRTAKFDLNLAATESSEGLILTLEYSTDLFDATTAERMLRQLESILGSVVADPLLPLERLPLLSGAERHQLLLEDNDTAPGPAPQLGLLEALAAQVARVPEATALVWGRRQLSYRELERRASGLAWRLRSL